MNQHDQAIVFKMLEKAGAVYLNRHFVYTSGKHGSSYVDIDRIYPDILTMWQLASLMAQPFLTPNREVEVVAGIGASGSALASDVANRMRQAAHGVRRVWADKVGDDFAFNRADFADKLNGRGVLVVKDLLINDGSVAKTCTQVEAAGGEVVAVSVICNQSELTTQTLGWELHALSEVIAEDIAADDCSLCMHGVPIVTNIDHGGAFQAANPDYYGGFIEL